MQRDGGPGGPGAGGNPTGGSFTGPAEALEIIGNHAYAYSGQFAASTAAQTVLDFTSGNYYFLGEFHLYGAIDSTNPNLSRSATSGLLSLNGTNIITLAGGNSALDAPLDVFCQIIIPAYTEVKVVLEADANQAAQFMSVSMVGRIYRG